MNEHPESDAPQYTTSDDNQTSPAPATKKAGFSFILELARFVLIAAAIVIPIRLFVAQPFIVSGSSMDPTFLHGEYLIVDELSYRFENPERGDVVIFRFPDDLSKFFIKRIVGLPEETVEIANSTVTIINDSQPDGFVLEESYLEYTSQDNFIITLGDDEYFVMGDNRPASSDSRMWGPLEEDLIIGRALVRLLPVARADVLPGSVND